MLRKGKDFTLKDLSDETGIAEMVLSNIERGHFAKISVYEKLALYFGVSLDGLVRNDITMVIASMPMDAADCEPEGLIDIMQENAKKTGKKGERLVVALEKADLKDLPFANAVTDAPAHETGTHFDVLSFTEIGETKYIEVKSTQYAYDTAFYLTSAELEFLRSCIAEGKHYELQRVHDLKDPKKADRKIFSADEVLEKFELVPSVYRLELKEEYRT